MNKRMGIILVMVLLLSSLLTACGSGAPALVTYSQLPLFSGATESTNEALNNMLGGLLTQLKADSTIKNVEGKVYDVPSGTTWDTVKSFYSPALEKAGWTLAKSTDSNLGYARGNQAVNVMYVEGVGLVVVLSEAK